MVRKSLPLIAAVLMAACADPAASITADDAAASQDGVIGSGTAIEDPNCKGGYLGSGNVVDTCPKPGTP
jgi:hypothetical protein